MTFPHLAYLQARIKESDGVKIDFEQIRRNWDSSAQGEEAWLAKQSVNRALRWREIERHLQGVKTILDVGGATGAFSIQLAERGYSVTHLDFSPAMLDIARNKSRALENIRFIEANAADLSEFRDRSFDLVLNMDGPISSSGSEAGQVLRESCRVTGNRLIVTVAHRAWMAAAIAGASVKATGRLLPAVRALMFEGAWHAEQFPENAALTEQFSFIALKAFLPGEVKAIMEQAGMKVLRAGGIGSLAALCDEDAIEQALASDSLFQEFLDMCEHFDKEILSDGPGSRDDTGLIAVAERSAMTENLQRN